MLRIRDVAIGLDIVWRLWNFGDLELCMSNKDLLGIDNNIHIPRPSMSFTSTVVSLWFPDRLARTTNMDTKMQLRDLAFEYPPVRNSDKLHADVHTDHVDLVVYMDLYKRGVVNLTGLSQWRCSGGSGAFHSVRSRSWTARAGTEHWKGR